MHPTLTEPMVVTCRCGRDVAMRAIASQDGIARIGECAKCDMQFIMPVAQPPVTWHERIGYRAGTN